MGLHMNLHICIVQPLVQNLKYTDWTRRCTIPLCMYVQPCILGEVRLSSASAPQLTFWPQGSCAKRGNRHSGPVPALKCSTKACRWTRTATHASRAPQVCRQCPAMAHLPPLPGPPPCGTNTEQWDRAPLARPPEGREGGVGR